MQPSFWMNWVSSPSALFVFFLAMWCLSCYWVAATSGWNALAKRFRLTGRFRGEILRFRSGRMRFYTRYGNSLSIGADRAGLYLAVLPLFRIGHPPLLVPWPEVVVIAGERGFLFKTRVLRLGRAESIPLRISVSLFENLRQSAGSAWPLESLSA